MINRNSRRIEDLIKKLMDSAQQAVLEMSEYNINEILDQTVLLALDRIKLRGVTIEKDYDGKMCNIQVDGEKVKVAMLNIIINAIEAVPEHGKIEIKTELNDDECIVVIADNGIGIEEVQLSQLFDPFFTGKKKGLGLGLTTTLNILNSHDAILDVDSKPGVGTTFTVRFMR
jgi:signal transduction histidine kinase